MASQCEPPSVWGSALTMRVQGIRKERDDGNKSEGKTSRKILRHAEYTESERCPLEIGHDFAREIYQDSTVVFEAQQASDGLRQGSAKL
jgi:hypothetical protein